MARPRTPPSLSLNWFLGLALLLAITFACQPRAVSQFPHKLHMADLHCGGTGQHPCLSCTSCHQAQAGKEPPLLPELDACSECHPKDAALQLQTVTAGRTLDAPLAHSIRFSHAKHTQMAELRGECVHCHKEVAGKAGSMFPPMATCFECHEHQEQFDRGQCGPCHEGHDVARLLPVTFMPHDANWTRQHGASARSGQAVCASCHAQKQCDDCHNTAQVLSIEMRRPEEFERNFVHSGDFMTRHGFEARQNPSKCSTCHTPQSCDGCHLQRGVSANALGARSPHPPGFMGSNTRDPEFHGRAARRDIASCAACHDQGPATNCISCHRVGGYGGNPHPRGWMSGGTNRHEGACRYCHD